MYFNFQFGFFSFTFHLQNFSTSLSISAYKTSQNLLNPLLKMISTRESFNGLQNFYTPVANDLGIDLHLVSARTFDEEEVKPSAGLVFYRPLVDICFLGSPTPSNGIVSKPYFNLQTMYFKKMQKIWIIIHSYQLIK